MPSLLVCCLTSPLIPDYWIYHLFFLLCLRGTASLRLELSFITGSVQHTAVFIYLRPLGTSVNKQYMLKESQFQSICMKVHDSSTEAMNRGKQHFYWGEVIRIQRVLLRNYRKWGQKQGNFCTKYLEAAKLTDIKGLLLIAILALEDSWQRILH